MLLPNNIALFLFEWITIPDLALEDRVGFKSENPSDFHWETNFVSPLVNL